MAIFLPAFSSVSMFVSALSALILAKKKPVSYDNYTFLKSDCRRCRILEP